MKAQGLLLLLARSDSGYRARRWLQDKLWSDRGFEQGAGSLRQTLTQIRRSLAEHRDVIGADRQRVWLDLDQVRIDSSEVGDLAEGLDVRDQEFEHWLTAERNKGNLRELPSKPDRGVEPLLNISERALILVDLPQQSEAAQNWVQTLFADAVLRLMQETYSANFVESSTSLQVADGLRLRLECQRVTDSMTGLRAELSSGQHGVRRWSDSCVVEAGNVAPLENLDVALLAWEVGEAFGEMILNQRQGDPSVFEADVLCRLGIRKLFSLQEEDVAEADALFAHAAELNHRGLYLAWRAQVRTVQRIERHQGDLGTLRQSGRYFCQTALELEPRNSWVLALAANTHLFLLGEALTSLEYAERAVVLGPANPMAWWAVSSARLYCGDAQRAYAEAVRGRNLAARSPHRFWWDLQQFASAMMLGRTQEAISLLESCVGQRSTFRPPLRYLAALRATGGEELRARSAVNALSRMESDFSVDRLLQDRDYPASLIHSAPVIDIKKVANLLK